MASEKTVQEKDEFGEIVSTLIIRGAYYMDTGGFTCFPASEDIDSPSAQSVYVYVRGIESLFVRSPSYHRESLSDRIVCFEVK